MNVLLISFGIYQFDGRLQELKKICDKLGSVKLVCFGDCKNNKYIVTTGFHYSVFNFIKLLIVSLFEFFRTKKIDVLFIDNCYVAWIGYFLSFFRKNKIIIYDMRELYLNDNNNLKLKLLLFFEKKLIEKANYIYVANDYRRNEVLKRFKISGEVLVFENVRFLVDANELPSDIFGKLKPKDCFNIISTGGYSTSRGSDYLISQFLKLPPKYKLFIVGTGKKEFMSIYGNDNIDNKVLFVDKMPIDDLRDLMKDMDIGIVHYSFKDLNNIYCASGKVYEYIGEGIPVVTTEHLTLIDFCNESHAGIADNEYVSAIVKISNELLFYKNNAINYANKNSIKQYTNIFSKSFVKKVITDE